MRKRVHLQDQGQDLTALEIEKRGQTGLWKVVKTGLDTPVMRHLYTGWLVKEESLAIGTRMALFNTGSPQWQWLRIKYPIIKIEPLKE